MTDHLIAVSGELKELLLRKSTRADVHLMYNAVEMSVFPSEADVSELRKRYGLTEKQFWLGTAARLEEVKNLQLLIKAARILKKKYPKFDFRVSIFGEGSLRDDLNLQIEQQGLSGQVFLEGHTNAIMPVLQALDVFTLTSLHEGLPMSLLEAMFVGTIPVCTAVGGMQEAIIHGKDGFLVDSGNAEELADTFGHIYSEGENLDHVRVKADISHIKKYNSLINFF